MFARLRKIAFKLAILAGVPVIGALLLSVEIGNGAREQARAAAAIGSIEDLAALSGRMTDTVDELETERAVAALALGLSQASPSDASALELSRSALRAQEAKTDSAVRGMALFLLKVDLSQLPPRLRGDLNSARLALQLAPAERRRIADGSASIDGLLDYYGTTNAALIDATAALTRLSNDGEVLRALSSLVALMQVKECESRAHAVLSHTFAIGEFAPGMYRYLVTLITERGVNAASLQSFATADQVASYQRTLTLPAASRAASMLKRALEAPEDGLLIDAHDWFAAQANAIQDLGAIETLYAKSVHDIALIKVDQSRRFIRYCASLVIAVVVVSLGLAAIIGSGITRSVLALVSVAGKVQHQQDFSLRAVKTTNDELGTLTDAFNEMLSVIQQRNHELSSHQENLEQTVLDRTLELSRRNEDMRLVLDTVEQGLATLDSDGGIAAERSHAFDAFFGAPQPNATFFEHIAAGNAELMEALRLDWLRVAGSLVSDANAGLIESRVRIGERHFELGYKPILKDKAFVGALLTVSDVTAETAEAAARERLEKELQLAQKLEGVGQLAAGVAHEINTPMQYIGDNLQFLSRAFEKLSEHLSDVDTAVSAGTAQSLDEARGMLEASKLRLKLAYVTKNVPKALQDSSAGVAHVSNIVRAMKSFAHVDGDEKTTGDINQALRDTLVVAQNEYKSCSVVETDLGEVPAVRCFPGRLNQVFLNLIVNAAHAIADAKRPSGGKISVTSRAENGIVTVTIADNGLGIPEHVRHKVFDPFFTTKPVGKGTGQGLAISRNIVVDAHGGTLTFETELGQGTAFTVRLPVSGVASESVRV